MPLMKNVGVPCTSELPAERRVRLHLLEHLRVLRVEVGHLRDLARRPSTHVGVIFSWLE